MLPFIGCFNCFPLSRKLIDFTTELSQTFCFRIKSYFQRKVLKFISKVVYLDQSFRDPLDKHSTLCLFPEKNLLNKLVCGVGK